MNGGGKGTRIQIHSPTWLGRFGLFVLAFGDSPFHIVATCCSQYIALPSISLYTISTCSSVATAGAQALFPCDRSTLYTGRSFQNDDRELRAHCGQPQLSIPAVRGSAHRCCCRRCCSYWWPFFAEGSISIGISAIV